MRAGPGVLSRARHQEGGKVLYGLRGFFERYASSRWELIVWAYIIGSTAIRWHVQGRSDRLDAAILALGLILLLLRLLIGISEYKHRGRQT
jgi:hypothetical protein